MKIENSFLQDLLKDSQNILELSFTEISSILTQIKHSLKKESLLLELNTTNPEDEVFVIGDLHGNLKSLLKLVDEINNKKPKLVVFLGDLVDRGPNQLSCLIYIFCLKLLEPKKYYILRGNHETFEMNKAYGFAYEFLQKFQDFDKFSEVLSVYDELPICSIVNDTVLCAHGGIPLNKDALRDIKDVKFQEIDESMAQSIYQIMWNDPKEGIDGFSPSFRGPNIYFFGKDVFEEFMIFNNLKYLIRSHECFPEGYKWFFNKTLLSIFSSENYRGIGAPNPLTYAIIKKEKIIPKILE